MSKRNNIIITAICVCLSFFVGLFTCCWWKNGSCNIDTTINVLDAISLAATISVGIYIAKILQKEVQDKRIEKDMYLGLILSVERILNDLETLIENSEESTLHYKRVVSIIHRCRIKKTDIFKALDGINNKLLKSQINDLDQRLKKELQILKTALTETSVNSLPTPPVKLENNIIHYSEDRIIEIITSINIIESIFFKLKVIVNNL